MSRRYPAHTAAKSAGNDLTAMMFLRRQQQGPAQEDQRRQQAAAALAVQRNGLAPLAPRAALYVGQLVNSLLR